VRLQLRLDPLHGCEGSHRRDFAALPVEVVAGEVIAEQVRLQLFVDRGRELEQRALDWGA
jgi:hypothetical protein